MWGFFRQALNGRNIALADRAARKEPLTLDQALEYVILLAEKCDVNPRRVESVPSDWRKLNRQRVPVLVSYA